MITKSGEIKDITVLKGVGFGIDKEALRVISKMPSWTPGMQDGKPYERALPSADRFRNGQQTATR